LSVRPAIFYKTYFTTPEFSRQHFLDFAHRRLMLMLVTAATEQFKIGVFFPAKPGIIDVVNIVSGTAAVLASEVAEFPIFGTTFNPIIAFEIYFPVRFLIQASPLRFGKPAGQSGIH
jgi:hypothetical protein